MLCERNPRGKHGESCWKILGFTSLLKWVSSQNNDFLFQRMIETEEVKEVAIPLWVDCLGRRCWQFSSSVWEHEALRLRVTDCACSLYVRSVVASQHYRLSTEMLPRA